MHMMAEKPKFARAVMFILMMAVLVLLRTALAHPEDELCTPDSGMDPQLCKQLQAMDRAQTVDPTPVTIDRPILETVGLYVKLGFVHILPRGFDHILFVLGLFLAMRSRHDLLWQISAFTVAHTITLALASSGVISPSADFVEPLIALSIAYVAIENMVFPTMTRWRPLIVFGFGLFHGLGFAGVFQELGLVKDQFLTTLISFNIGVELGQLAIILAAFILARMIQRIALPAGHTANIYRRYIVIPGSLLIGAIGLYWFVTRLIDVLA